MNKSMKKVEKKKKKEKFFDYNGKMTEKLKYEKQKL